MFDCVLRLLWRRAGPSRCGNFQHVLVYNVVEQANNCGMYSTVCCCVGHNKARGRQGGLRPLFAYAFSVTVVHIGLLAKVQLGGRLGDDVFVLGAKHP